MNIVSINFLLFIILTMIIYWFVDNRYKNDYLLLVGLIFGISFGIDKLALTVTYSLIVYGLSQIKNGSLFLSIIISVLPLLYSKYLYIIMERYFGLSLPGFSIIGISYITFKAISYLVEVKKDDNNKLTMREYMLFMLFYPVLLSGPIENPKKFAGELRKEKRFNENEILHGMLIVAIGYFMKLVIADRLHIYIDFFYSGYEKYGFLTWFSILSYSFYIYCDFCGYSYIALGIAKMLGIDVTINFKSPYLSRSCRDFWNHWHISLNNWLKNYIYIPLGGSRKGKMRKYLNILATFFVSGVWHGAGLGFIVWGLLNGVYQIAEDMFSNKRKENKTSEFQNVLHILRTYLLITFSWIFFDRGLVTGIKVMKSSIRMPSVSIVQIREDMAGIISSVTDLIPLAIAFVFIAIVFIVEINLRNKPELLEKIKNSRPLYKYLVIFLLIMIVIMFGYFSSFNAANFIYFNF